MTTSPSSQRRPRLGDVAELAGVSPTTVSRVLNNRGYLSDQTKTAVHDAMKALAYTPNAVARSLKNQRTDTIGVIFPSLMEPFYAEVAHEVESALALRGKRMFLGTTGGNSAEEQRYFDLLRANQVDGVITGAHTDIVSSFDAAGFAVVTIDRTAMSTVPNVRCDNYGGEFAAVAAVLAGGSTRPVHLCSEIKSTNLRQRAFVAAVEAAEIDPVMVAVGFTSSRAEQLAVVEELVRSRRHDAIVASNDVLAAMAYHIALAEGIAVPEELQIVGFDGTELMRTLHSGVATVRQPIAEIAQRAVSIVLGEETVEGEVILPAELHRGTTIADPV